MLYDLRAASTTKLNPDMGSASGIGGARGRATLPDHARRLRRPIVYVDIHGAAEINARPEDAP